MVQDWPTQGDTRLSAIPVKSGLCELPGNIRCRWLPAARCWYLQTWLSYRGRKNYPQSHTHSAGVEAPGIPARAARLSEISPPCNLSSFPMNEKRGTTRTLPVL